MKILRMSMGACALVLLLRAVAFGVPVDLARLSVNGIKPGDSVARVRKMLGEPTAVQGPKGRVFEYGRGVQTMTVELTTDARFVSQIRNGQVLTSDGKVLLSAGDAIARIGVMLAGLQPEVRTGPRGVSYLYTQGRLALAVWAKDGRVFGFVLAVR